MPNTIIHIAVQSAATPTAWRRSSNWQLLFVLLGAVLPDLPWIAQRVLRPVIFWMRGDPGPSGDQLLTTLKLYSGAQGSLMFCVVLALAVALLCRKPCGVFLLLSWGAIVHLLLDATQIKWANGALLLAPFSWKPVRFDLFWPESTIVDVATLVCALALLPIAWAVLRRNLPPYPFSIQNWKLALLLVALWIAGPWLYVPQLRAADAFSARSLQEDAVGQQVELGVAKVFLRDGEVWVRTLSERQLRLQLPASLQRAPEPGNVSFRGRLKRGGPVGGLIEGATTKPSNVDSHSSAILVVDAFHQHRPRTREAFSLFGLLFIALLWALPLLKAKTSRPPRSSTNKPRASRSA